MRKQEHNHIASRLLPCILMSAVAGSLTGILIFTFKYTTAHIVTLSEFIYRQVRQMPILFPCLILGAALLGLLAALLLRFAKSCRGGGIPTAVAAMRGLIPLHWIQSLIVLFFTSQLAYLGGVPLGSEGPSVQMGAAIGQGTSSLVSKKPRAWERYLMTGGACAGFATALGAPLTGVLFAVEEAHRRFSPMIFASAAVSVVSGLLTQELLSGCFHISTALFNFPSHRRLPLRLFWVPILIGGLCGLFAILFTKGYRLVRKFHATKLKKIPFCVRLMLIFATVSLLGFLCEDFIGSGHALIEKILHGQTVWYMLLLALGIRAVLLLFANNTGVSGGMFVPMLAFGAIIAALISEIVFAIDLIDRSYASVLIAIGMASFLAAASRTPITALAFALEVLCGINNILPVGIGVAFAYLIIESARIPAFNDTVIEAKTENANDGKTPIIVNTKLTVQAGAFAIGQEVHDILWPPTCRVLDIEKGKHADHTHALCEGDVLHLHYQTFDPDDTLETLYQILGYQIREPKLRSRIRKKNHEIPAD